MLDNKEYTTFTPWFGSWPPEFRGESEGIKMSKLCGEKELTKWKIIFILVGIIIVGLILAGLRQYVPSFL